MLTTRLPLEGHITLDADQRQVLEKVLQEMRYACGYLSDQIKSDQAVKKETAHNALYIVESSLSQLCKDMGIEMESVAEREARYAQIRQANLRIHELERQIGGAVTPHALSAGIKEYARRIDQWWDEYGFGYISQMEFGKHGGCQLKLSLNPRARLHSISQTPVSDKESYDAWLSELESFGCTILREHGHGDEEIQDTPAARDYLKKLVLTHFPTATLTDVESRYLRSGQCTLRYLGVYVPCFQEIADLKISDSSDAP